MNAMIEAFDKATGLLEQERDAYEMTACELSHKVDELQWLVNEMLPYIMDLPAFDDFICDAGHAVYADLANRLNCKPSKVPDEAVVTAFLNMQQARRLKS